MEPVILGVLISVVGGLILLAVKWIPYRKVRDKFLEIIKASKLAWHSVRQLKKLDKTKVMNCSWDSTMKFLAAFGYVQRAQHPGYDGTVRCSITLKGIQLLAKRMPRTVVMAEILRSGWLRGKVKTFEFTWV